MTKHVYPTSQVFHLWANRHDVAIRNPSGNVFAEDGKLHSYGYHWITAAFLDNPAKGGKALLLWNDASTSATTNKHRSEAFRALTSTQRQNLTRVPTMSRGTSPGELSDVADGCIVEAMLQFERSAKARSNRPYLVGSANRYLQSAIDLFLYVGKTKSAKLAQSLMAPPDASKPDIVAICARIKKAQYLETAGEQFSRATDYFSRAVGFNDTPERQKRDCDVFARDAASFVNSAKNEYKKAQTRIPAKLAKLEKEITLFRASIADACMAESLNESRTQTLADMRNMAVTLALYQRKKHGHDTTFTLSTGRRLNRPFNFRRDNGNTPWLPDGVQFRAMFGDNTKSHAIEDEFTRLYRKLSRVQAAIDFNSVLKSERENVESIREAIDNGTHIYRVPDVGNMHAQLRQLDKVFGQVPQYLQGLAERSMADVTDAREAYRVQAIARNAEKVQAWRNGENVRLPQDVPTMARVVGDAVQTSHGASVPLAHACRLIRIAERVAANGGKEWPNGDGPMVGHFRVIRIDADMTAVIGCHEFESTEARHAIELIRAACEAAKIETQESDCEC
jgi:hypothetical protein